jgi:hypothetical protein
MIVWALSRQRRRTLYANYRHRVIQVVVEGRVAGLAGRYRGNTTQSSPSSVACAEALAGDDARATRPCRPGEAGAADRADTGLGSPHPGLGPHVGAVARDGPDIFGTHPDPRDFDFNVPLRWDSPGTATRIVHPFVTATRSAIDPETCHRAMPRTRRKVKKGSPV